MEEDDYEWKTRQLAKLTNLTSLTLGHVHDLSIRFLSTSTLPLSLQSLSLNECRFCSSGFTFGGLSKLSSLHSLVLFETGVSGRAPWGKEKTCYDSEEEDEEEDEEEEEYYLPVSAALSLLQLRDQLSYFSISPCPRWLFTFEKYMRLK